jgi:hypothetical protein
VEYNAGDGWRIVTDRSAIWAFGAIAVFGTQQQAEIAAKSVWRIANWVLRYLEPSTIADAFQRLEPSPVSFRAVLYDRGPFPDPDGAMGEQLCFAWIRNTLRPFLYVDTTTMTQSEIEVLESRGFELTTGDQAVADRAPAGHYMLLDSDSLSGPDVSKYNALVINALSDASMTAGGSTYMPASRSMISDIAASGTCKVRVVQASFPAQSVGIQSPAFRSALLTQIPFENFSEVTVYDFDPDSWDWLKDPVAAAPTHSLNRSALPKLKQTSWIDIAITAPFRRPWLYRQDLGWRTFQDAETILEWRKNGYRSVVDSYLKGTPCDLRARFDEMMQRAPKFNGIAYRGMDEDWAADELYRASTKSVVQFKAPHSCSVDPMVATQFADNGKDFAILAMKTHSAADITADNPEECEVIIPAGTFWRVVEFTEIPYGAERPGSKVSVLVLEEVTA